MLVFLSHYLLLKACTFLPSVILCYLQLKIKNISTNFTHFGKSDSSVGINYIVYFMYMQVHSCFYIDVILFYLFSNVFAYFSLYFLYCSAYTNKQTYIHSFSFKDCNILILTLMLRRINIRAQCNNSVQFRLISKRF